MQGTPSKAELLQAIRDEAARWDALLAEIGEERMTQPGVTGDWTFKDVVAHLTGWRTGETLHYLEAARSGAKPAPPPWPENFTTDEANQWIYERNRDRPLHDVLREYRQSFRQLEEALAAVPEEHLIDPHRFEWPEGHGTEGHALGPAIVEFGHWREEHEPDVRAWMRKLEA
jgi:hypothetical protein